MNHTIKINIEAGETTCASSPGNFCQFFATTHFGMTPVCCLFPTEREFYTCLDEKDGWIQRCDDCLKHCKQLLT